MNNNLSFAKLDIAALKPQKKTLYQYLIVIVFLGIVIEFISTLFFTVMFGIIAIISYPFVISEKNNLDILYSTLSLERRNVVIGRYIFPVLVNVISVVSLLIFAYIKSNFVSLDMALKEVLLYLSIASMFLLIIVSIQYPVYFKMGYSKARLFTYIPLFALFGIVAIFALTVDKLNININWSAINQMFDKNFALVLILPILIGMISLVISCMISLKIYEKKDI